MATATTLATAGSLNGVGAAKAIPQVTINRANGLAFEDAALSARGIASNSQAVAGRTLSGALRNTIPDSLDGGVFEVKSGAYQALTPQMQAQIDYAATTGQQYNLTVNIGTKVSAPLEKTIGNAGGVISRFDPASGSFHRYP
jgi:hypothetical protein